MNFAEKGPNISPSSANKEITRRRMIQSSLGAGAGMAVVHGNGAHISHATAVQSGDSRLVLGIGNEPSTLDPQFEQSGIIGTFLNPMLEHLTEFDRNLEIKNVLAQEVEMPTDGVTYTFRLREGMTFWDGTPVDAHAIKFTYDRALDPANRESGLSDPVPILQGVDHVNVVDDLTVEVVTAEPSTLAWPFFVQEFILAPDHYTEKSWEETAIEPMGSGPWKFVSWTKGGQLEMEANENYWRGAPKVESLVFRNIPESSTRLAMLETGEVDIISDVNPDDLPLIESHEHLRVESALTTYRVYVGVPTNQPRWQHRDARMALNHAINVDEIIEFVLGGLPGERLRTPVITEGWINDNIPSYSYDPDRARELLNAADFDWEQPVTLYTNSAGMKRVDVAQAVVSDLNALGMNAEVQVLENSVFRERLVGQQFDDLYLHQLGAPSYGPIETALPTGDLGLDSSHFLDATENGPAYLELYEQVRTEFDVDEQHRLVSEMQELFMEEAAWILLYRDVSLFGVNNRTDWVPTEYSRLHFWLPDEDSVGLTE